MVLEDGGGENSPAFPLGLSVTADAPSFLLSPSSPSSSSSTLPETYGSAPGGRVRDSTNCGCTRRFLLDILRTVPGSFISTRKVYSEKIRKTQLYKSLVC